MRSAATVCRPKVQKVALDEPHLLDSAAPVPALSSANFVLSLERIYPYNDYVSKIGSKIVLIDGSRLAELMIEFGVAVAADATYTVNRIDNDFFESI